MKQQFAAKHPWAILAAGAAIQILTGLPAAWGVFQQPVMDEFGLTEDGAGYAFGILIAAFGVGCVIGGFLQDKKGPRCAALWGTGLLCGGFFAAALLPGEKGGWFWAVFSIPAGLGTAFLYPSIQSCAQKWYAGRKGLATGVIGGAVGLSGAFLTGFVRTALKGFGPVQGIRGAFWALGALTLPVCLVGSALLTDPPPAKQKPEEQGRGKGTPALDLAPLQMLRTKQYWLCAGAVCCSTPAVLLFSPIILKLGMERGLDEGAALWSVVLGSVGSAAGRLLMPLLSDRIGRRPTDLILFGVSLGLSAAFLFAQGWLVVAVYAGLTFCYSALAAVLRGGNVTCEVVEKISGPHDGERPNIGDLIADGKIAVIVNTPYGPGSRGDGYLLRTEAVRRGVTCVTAMSAANTYVSAIEAVREDQQGHGSANDMGMDVIALQDLPQHTV